MNTTTTTTTTKKNSSKKTNPPSKTTTTTTTKKSTPKTARNRRRRQRRNALRNSNNAGQKYLSRYFQHDDPTMEISVHKAIQSLFYPQRGIHRSIASGLEPTAITYYQGSIGMETTATNNVITFLFIPALLAAPALAGTPSFLQVRTAGTVASPINAAAQSYGGPFASVNPMVSGRCVSFSINIIPQSTVLNRGGAGKVGYVSDYPSLAYTPSDFDNLAISRSVDGTESMSMHWVPGANEYDFGPGNSTTSSYSALCGYIINTLGVINGWRVEWQIGIEYNPTATYRPLVDRKEPDIRPDARYFINHIIQKHWTPLMISTLGNYEARLKENDVGLGGMSKSTYVDHAGFGGIGFANPQNADIIADIEEEAYDTQDGAFDGVKRAMSNVACDVARTLTGEDVCGAPLRSAVNLGRKMMGQNGYASLRY